MTQGWRPHAAASAGMLLFIGICAGCSEKQQAAPEPRLVNAIRVNPSNTTNDVAYSGEVRPRYESNLSFRVPGKIVARKVEVGGMVSKGNVLAKLDPEDQYLNTRSAESQQAAAQSEYEQSKAELARYTDLYEKKFISKAEFDRHQNDFNVAKARLEQSQAQLAVSKNQSGYTELSADHAGVVTALLAEVGQVVAAGQTVMKVARTDEREVGISIPENRLTELSAARQIDISLWSDPSKIYQGKLREVSPSADPVTRTYAAKISVLNADPAMKLGMTANVYLRGLPRTSALLLPATALFQDNGHAAVWVVDKTTSKVALVPVEISEYVDDRVGVISGLSPGDLIVRAGVHKLYAGEKVRVHEEPVAEAKK